MDWKDKKMKLQGLNGTLPCELLNGTLFFTLCQFLSTICKFNFFLKKTKLYFIKLVVNSKPKYLNTHQWS